MSQLKAGICALSVLAGVGALVMIYSTDKGIGIGSDSLVYIDAARNHSHGKGLIVLAGPDMPAGANATDRDFVPLTHFPPLFPLALSAASILGLDAPEAARWLNTILFAVTGMVIGVVILVSTRAALPAVLGAILWFASPVVLMLHSSAWSEPLCLLFLILGLAFTAAFLKSGKAWQLALAGAAAAAASLTRYAAIAVIPAIAIGLLCFQAVNLRRRLLHCGVFLVIATLPMGIWALHNLVLAGTAINRHLVFHRLSSSHVWLAVQTISRFIVPQDSSGAFALAALPAILAAGFFSIRWGLKNRRERACQPAPLVMLPALLALFGIVYVTFVVAAVCFAHFNTDLDARMLSPVLVSLIVWVGCAWSKILRLCRSRPFVSFLLASTYGAVVLLYCLSGSKVAAKGHNEGLDFTSTEWASSPILSRTRSLPPGVAIYSNGSRLIHHYTGQVVRSIPWKRSPTDASDRPEYAQEMREMGQRLSEGHAVLVWFDRIKKSYFPAETELRESLHLVPVVEEKNGTIYRMSAGPTTSEGAQNRGSVGTSKAWAEEASSSDDRP